MPPTSWYEPMVMPLICTFFGVLIWAMGMLAEHRGKAAPWKWIGLIVIAIGIGFGFGPFMKIQDLTYRLSLPTVRRFIYAHYAALVIPALALVACVLWQVLGKKPVPADNAVAE